MLGEVLLGVVELVKLFKSVTVNGVLVAEPDGVIESFPQVELASDSAAGS